MAQTIKASRVQINREGILALVDMHHDLKEIPYFACKSNCGRPPNSNTLVKPPLPCNLFMWKFSTTPGPLLRIISRAILDAAAFALRIIQVEVHGYNIGKGI
jgi:hypothetical protein